MCIVLKLVATLSMFLGDALLYVMQVCCYLWYCACVRGRVGERDRIYVKGAVVGGWIAAEIGVACPSSPASFLFISPFFFFPIHFPFLFFFPRKNGCIVALAVWFEREQKRSLYKVWCREESYGVSGFWL